MKQRWEYSDTCQNCGEPVGEKRAKGLCQKCYRNEYRVEHHEKTLELQRGYYHPDPKSMDRITERWEQRKAEAIAQRGGKCACCGETEQCFCA